MDEATLRYVRANHHEWIAPTGYKWADGYFILAVSPTHRQIGTYFGEDIAPALSILSEIQDAAKDDFRENASKVAEEWQALEGRRGEVERAFVALLEAGDYTTGLSARYECARAEYERVPSRIAQTQSTHFLGTMSAQASDETQEILTDLHALADAVTSVLALDTSTEGTQRYARWQSPRQNS